MFVDGKYFSTLTNLAPRAGNVLTVRVNGYPVSYAVPANATLSNVAAGLATVLNDPATTNITGVSAFVHGDRIELHSMVNDSAHNVGRRVSVSTAVNRRPPKFLNLVGLVASNQARSFCT